MELCVADLRKFTTGETSICFLESRSIRMPGEETTALVQRFRKITDEPKAKLRIQSIKKIWRSASLRWTANEQFPPQNPLASQPPMALNCRFTHDALPPPTSRTGAASRSDPGINVSYRNAVCLLPNSRGLAVEPLAHVLVRRASRSRAAGVVIPDVNRKWRGP